MFLTSIAEAAISLSAAIAHPGRIWRADLRFLLLAGSATCTLAISRFR